MPLGVEAKDDVDSTDDGGAMVEDAVVGLTVAVYILWVKDDVEGVWLALLFIFFYK